MEIDLDDLRALLKRIKDPEISVDLMEEFHAFQAGWNQDDYRTLYASFVLSTQISLEPEDDATKIKGKPLEDLATYLLVKSGLAKTMTEIRHHNVWQVDGQGLINLYTTNRLFGEKVAMLFGTQVFMEAKNHKKPMASPEFNVHRVRMSDHGCSLGISISATGFSCNGGKGIAEHAWTDFLQQRFHLLIGPSCLASIASGTCPLAVLRDSYARTANDSYRSDKVLRRRFQKQACLALLEGEAERIAREAETAADETADAPTDETPADETPADEPPADETPADETPADETPADETPADETPADETPADETPLPSSEV